jgi:transposase
VVRHWQRGERRSLLSALAVSPKGKRLQLFWDLQTPAYRKKDFVRLVRQLRRRLGNKLLLIWDSLPGHRAAAKVLEGPGLHVEFLPGYAPELNPVEWVWSQAKYAEMANWVPEDTDELEERYHDTLAGFNQEQALLRSFFAGAKLPLDP